MAYALFSGSSQRRAAGSLDQLVAGSAVPVWLPQPWPDDAGSPMHEMERFGPSWPWGYLVVGNVTERVRIDGEILEVPILAVSGKSPTWRLSTDRWKPITNFSFPAWYREFDQGSASVAVHCPGTLVIVASRVDLVTAASLAATLCPAA